MLRERYLQYMLDNYSSFYNPDYRAHKLKSKLINHFGSQLHFWQPNFKSELVYSSDLPKGHAVQFAFEVAASESKRLEEAALILHRTIVSAKKDFSEMPWSPSTSFLKSNSIHPPSNLQEFISYLINKKNSSESSGMKQRLCLSFANDICTAITGVTPQPIGVSSRVRRSFDK